MKDAWKTNFLGHCLRHTPGDLCDLFGDAFSDVVCVIAPPPQAADGPARTIYVAVYAAICNLREFAGRVGQVGLVGLIGLTLYYSLRNIAPATDVLP